MEKYRYDNAYGKLYKYSKEQDSYLFVCNNIFGISEKELIEEVENGLLNIFDEFSTKGE
jgi:hypothetical protein